MVRYARWKYSILLWPNSVGIPDSVFKSVKLSLHDWDHNKCKQHSVGHKKIYFQELNCEKVTVVFLNT